MTFEFYTTSVHSGLSGGSGVAFLPLPASTSAVTTITGELSAHEAWLYKNPSALKSVRRGIRQAKLRAFVKGPDLKAAAKFAEQLQDV